MAALADPAAEAAWLTRSGCTGSIGGSYAEVSGTDMSTFAVTVLAAGVGSLGVACGYAVRLFQERLLADQRERALAALGGGELPQWEKVARQMEDEADLKEMNLDPYTARHLRRQASALRRVQRARLRRGLTPLPLTWGATQGTQKP